MRAAEIIDSAFIRIWPGSSSILTFFRSLPPGPLGAAGSPEDRPHSAGALAYRRTQAMMREAMAFAELVFGMRLLINEFFCGIII